MSRRTRYNETVPSIAAGLYRRGADDSVVAEAVGVARSTLSTWRKKYPEFDEACANSKASANAQVESALFTQAVKGNVTAQIFWLCNRDPDHWRNVNRVEMSGPDGGAINFTDTAKDVRERLAGKLTGIAASSAASGVPSQPE